MLDSDHEVFVPKSQFGSFQTWKLEIWRFQVCSSLSLNFLHGGHKHYHEATREFISHHRNDELIQICRFCRYCSVNISFRRVKQPRFHPTQPSDGVTTWAWPVMEQQAVARGNWGGVDNTGKEWIDDWQQHECVRVQIHAQGIRPKGQKFEDKQLLTSHSTSLCQIAQYDLFTTSSVWGIKTEGSKGL